MAQALLVATERQVIAKLAEALDDRELDVRIIVLAKFDEYTDSRLVLASPVFDRQRGLASYLEFGYVVRELKFYDDEVPSPLILPMDDPVILALQENPGPMENERGLNIGLHMLGNRYLEDGYVFRVRK